MVVPALRGHIVNPDLATFPTAVAIIFPNWYYEKTK
jgi:hypothetical protein